MRELRQTTERISAKIKKLADKTKAYHSSYIQNFRKKNSISNQKTQYKAAQSSLLRAIIDDEHHATNNFTSFVIKITSESNSRESILYRNFTLVFKHFQYILTSQELSINRILYQTYILSVIIDLIIYKCWMSIKKDIQYLLNVRNRSQFRSWMQDSPQTTFASTSGSLVTVNEAVVTATAASSTKTKTLQIEKILSKNIVMKHIQVHLEVQAYK